MCVQTNPHSSGLNLDRDDMLVFAQGALRCENRPINSTKSGDAKEKWPVFIVMHLSVSCAKTSMSPRSRLRPEERGLLVHKWCLLVNELT